jgi:hypothetical protein
LLATQKFKFDISNAGMTIIIGKRMQNCNHTDGLDLMLCHKKIAHVNFHSRLHSDLACAASA